jgi:chromosome segregation ATPase
LAMIGHIEQLAERLEGAIKSLKEERDGLKAQCEELRGRLAEKELECIRLSKENLRGVELMERERMSFEKEKSRAEEQMKALYERLNSLVSDAAQKAKRPPGDERRA